MAAVTKLLGTTRSHATKRTDNEPACNVSRPPTAKGCRLRQPAATKATICLCKVEPKSDKPPQKHISRSASTNRAKRKLACKEDLRTSQVTNTTPSCSKATPTYAPVPLNCCLPQLHTAQFRLPQRLPPTLGMLARLPADVGMDPELSIIV